MVTSSNASTDLTLRNLSGLSLRRGDRDADHIWGGSARPTQAGTPVTELQTALITLGTLNNADGTFGPDTEEALRRFQWYVAHLHFRLQPLPGAAPASGTIVPFTASPGGPPGVCDAVTANLILSWLEDNFVTTSPLVRLNVALLSNIAVGEGFQQLDYPEAKKGEISGTRGFCSGGERHHEPGSEQGRRGPASQSDLPPRGRSACRRCRAASDPVTAFGGPRCRFEYCRWLHGKHEQVVPIRRPDRKRRQVYRGSQETKPPLGWRFQHSRFRAF